MIDDVALGQVLRHGLRDGTGRLVSELCGAESAMVEAGHSP